MAFFWVLVPAAWADQPALKFSNLNFGNEPVGSSTRGIQTATNTTSEPIVLDGGALTGIGDIVAIGAVEQTRPDSCRSLGVLGTLAAGQTCTIEVVFEPREPGRYLARSCVYTLDNPLGFCDLIRGHAN